MTSSPYFSARTLDDVMRIAIQHIMENGEAVSSTKGDNREVIGAVIEIEDPRARLSRTEMRGKLVSCLGEFLWYLGGSDASDWISYYVPKYRNYQEEGGNIHGAYGPRLFCWKDVNQFRIVTERLIKNPNTRKAVIQLFDLIDLVKDYKDVPCTCTLQFFCRGERLHLHVHMRSNDIYIGFPHDVFCFTMLQELMARQIDKEIGRYIHTVGSLHLYDENFQDARAFLQEGWQSTQISMPPMPIGDPWGGINVLLRAERNIREKGVGSLENHDSLDPYWDDFLKILMIFRHKRDKNYDRISSIQATMNCDIYHCFIDKMTESPE